MKAVTLVSILATSVLLLSACAPEPTKEPETLTPIATPQATADAYASQSAKPTTSPVSSPTSKGKTMNEEKISASIVTEKGTIELELYPKDAPKTVENFVGLAKKGYYDGVTFHRVVDGFVIQGGDPTGTGRGGTSIYGAKFEDELNPDTTSFKNGYKEGVLAMANAGPDTNGSQFFIMLDDNDTLPHAYTIFGKVTKGLDVVHKIVVGDKMTKVTTK